MAKLQLTDVEIYVKDLKAARAFYTKKIGLKVRSSMPKCGYLALGATKGGDDAALTPWQPAPGWGREIHESPLKMLGGDTGRGVTANALKPALAGARWRRGKTAGERGAVAYDRRRDPD